MFDFVEYKAVPGESQIPESLSLSHFTHLLSRIYQHACYHYLDIQQILTDPVQAVNDAADEVSNLYNKFQGSKKFMLAQSLMWLVKALQSTTHFTFAECAPDLSDPMSVARYTAEEISEAKDGFVRYFSDEEGMTAHSCHKTPQNKKAV